jgi:hypothetical protein
MNANNRRHGSPPSLVDLAASENFREAVRVGIDGAGGVRDAARRIVDAYGLSRYARLARLTPASVRWALDLRNSMDLLGVLRVVEPIVRALGCRIEVLLGDRLCSTSPATQPPM